MSSLARRDELLYESDAALRLLDRAIQEMRVADLLSACEDAEAASIVAGDTSVDAEELSAAD